jgi:hypothetical protein
VQYIFAWSVYKDEICSKYNLLWWKSFFKVENNADKMFRAPKSDSSGAYWKIHYFLMSEKWPYEFTKITSMANTLLGSFLIFCWGYPDVWKQWIQWGYLAWVTGVFETNLFVLCCNNTRWFKYDRDLWGLFTHKSVPVIFEPPCTQQCLERWMQHNN